MFLASSHGMQKYRVMIHGQNLLTEVDGVRRRLDFFTNVFIEAFTTADAESRAIDIIREDAGLADILLNPDDDLLSLSADGDSRDRVLQGPQATTRRILLLPMD
jgi:hypothetical protein